MLVIQIPARRGFRQRWLLGMQMDAFFVTCQVLLSILRDKEKHLYEGRSDSGGIKVKQTN
ncbi:hypothetical protein P40_14630 [Alloalcanivorax xenomutans]|nr:hypothetical protein P40_14630 [Alloalcanivorax xenomutans]